MALFSGSSGLQKEARDEFPGQGTPVGGATHMALGDLPLLSMMKLRLQWLGERQQVLAQNVANADTPGYAAKDLKELDFGALVNQQSGMLSPVATNSGHIGTPVVGASLTGTAAGRAAVTHARGGEVERAPDFETSPTGNSVVLEEQMMNAAQTQMDYQAVTGLYAKSVGLIKIALGRG